MKKLLTSVFCCFCSLATLAQQGEWKGKFEQLGPMLRSPNVYRTASGAPGSQYWQQKADYDIKVEIDDNTQRLTGEETITYTNNSPDPLTYLWLQLDQNIYNAHSDTYLTSHGKIQEKMSARALDRLMQFPGYEGSVTLLAVQDLQGKKLPYIINKTMMRLDLEKPLLPGEKYQFHIKWAHNINDRLRVGGRGGSEFFPEDGNYLYTIAQWFPRMAVYSDFEGWQQKQFLGSGEFALVFGDYDVRITVPSDHLVAATGVLQNPEEVLTSKQRELLKKAETAADPVIIVSQAEAAQKEKKRAKDKKTWYYHADNVRDFAFGSSRKFIWDAMGVKIGGKTVMAMSYYPKEANPLYEKYSTRAVAHTLRTYSKHTIDYPYPKAISVEASNGMEYPMICFNYGRPEKDGTYSERTKYGMIGVIIHEVGHNFFPMIINSDERQWTWMDEGLNTFCQFLAEQEWEPNYPSSRGPAAKIVPYMKGDKSGIRPIMTNSEQILQFGNNAYGKPAAALNILRETVIGRELFDFAFKTYAERWAFKHPTPEDFFRTMEDASGVDLDWFWKGWFYSTDHVDIALEHVTRYKVDTKNPAVENAARKQEAAQSSYNLTYERNKAAGVVTEVERKPELKDFYNTYDPHATTPADEKAYKTFYASLNDEEKKLISSGLNFYEITFRNVGGLVMPIILRFTYTDGTSEKTVIPAEIWRLNEQQVTKVFVKNKEVASIQLDPHQETADTEESNNFWPARIVPSRFDLFKETVAPRGSSTGDNPMQRARNKR